MPRSHPRPCPSRRRGRHPRPGARRPGSGGPADRRSRRQETPRRRHRRARARRCVLARGRPRRGRARRTRCSSPRRPEAARPRSGQRRSTRTRAISCASSESRNRASSSVRPTVATTRSNDGSSRGTGRRLRDVRASRASRHRAPRRSRWRALSRCGGRQRTRPDVERPRASRGRRCVDRSHVRDTRGLRGGETPSSSATTSGSDSPAR